MKNVILLTLSICLSLSVIASADELVLYSEAGSGTVEVSTAGPNSGFGTPVSPVVVPKNDAWTTITGATWISSANPRETNGTYGSWRLFTRGFTLPDNAYNISATIEIAADNAYAVSCNGAPVGDSGLSGSTNANGGVDTVDVVTWGSGPFPFQSTSTHTFTPIAGTNELEILARNWPGSSGGTGEGGSDNPAGLLYKVVVTYDVGITVEIDIKPGSDPNSINLTDQGVLPVAILGSSIDVSTIDLTKPITLGGTVVTSRGSAKAPKLAVSFEDVDGDHLMDLVAFFRVQDLVTSGALVETTTELMLEAETTGGVPISGTDTVNIVPPG